MRFKEYLNEETGERVYFVKHTFWVAYAPGSGTTSIKIEKNSYITDKSRDSHYDPIVNGILKFTKKTPALKKKENSKLYAIDVYDSYNHEDFQIWGGDIKPKDKKYMVINTDKITVVNFFDSKKEAITWLNTAN